MQMRKKVQLLLYPKIFNVMSFYSKGQYTVHVSLVQECDNGQLLYAMPRIITTKQFSPKDVKKPYIHTDKVKKQIAYVTQQFYITYNQQSVALHSMAVFDLQIDDNRKCKTYLEFVLMLNKYKISEDQNQVFNFNTYNSDSGASLSRRQKQAQETPKKRITVPVDRRRVYINDIMNLDQFKRVVFTQCEFFSFLDTYIGSCLLGSQVRLQKYQLGQFYCYEDKQKIEYRLQADNRRELMNDHERGLLLAKIAGLNVQQFRVKLSSDLQSSYLNIKRRMGVLLKLYAEDNVSFDRLGQIKQSALQEVQIETGFKSKEQLEKYYQSNGHYELFLEVYKQMAQLGYFIRHIWGCFIELVSNIPHRTFSGMIMKHLIRENAQKQKTLISAVRCEPELRKMEKQNFVKKRAQLLRNMKIYDDSDVYHPLIMVENYEPGCKNSQHVGSEINSLVVFVHGYQGSDYDLEIAKNYLSVYSANSYSLLIKSIQLQIDQGIELLGERVAQQIRSHVSSSIHAYKSISLVGYSLGGIVVRESVRHLAEYKDKMNLLVTFASPHLGVCLPDNRLVGTGIWYLINFEKVKNMKQLNCQKLNQNQEVTLMRLSESDNLSWFKKIVVVSSEEDNFIPHHSSRISETVRDERIQAMATNILSRVRKIERVEVWFDVEHDIGTVDRILGRRAHIEFLENRIFLDMFFRLYGKQF